MIEGQDKHHATIKSEIRNILNKNKGELISDETAALNWTKTGHITISKNIITQSQLIDMLWTCAPWEIYAKGEDHILTCDASSMKPIQEVLHKNKIMIQKSQIMITPLKTTPLTSQETQALKHLIPSLKKHQDILHVFCNVDGLELLEF